AGREARGRPHVALLEVAQVATEENRLNQRLPEVGRQDRNAGDRQQHRAKSAVIQRGPSDGGRRGELSDHDRELSAEVSPPAPSAPPPHQWDGAAPPAPSAPPPHEWGRRSSSGAFGATSP